MASGKPVPGGLSVALARDFGSACRWQAEFAALMQRGGAVLLWLPDEARLANRCTGSDGGPPIDAVPLFSVDAAQILDIDWDAINERYVAAVAAHTRGLGLMAAELSARRAEFDVLDVRRDVPFEAATDMIAGAARADPQHVARWANELDAGRKLVVYCVYGHEVGQSTAAALRTRGIDAHYLEGGIEQWKEQGRPLQPKGASS